MRERGVRIKVCGMTRGEDVRLAAELGAWAVGFIFYPPSPRFVPPRRAAAIAADLDPAVERVGVFVDAERSRIEDAAAAVGLTVVQLHGAESRSFAEDLAASGRSIWKAVRIGASLPREELEPFRGMTLVLDARVRGRPGGTGTTFPWHLAREAKEYGPVILAGGLTPENVEAAIQEVEPFAVDVASGVEERPGVKDPERLRRFFQAARAAPP